MKTAVELSKKDQRDFQSTKYYPGTHGNRFDSLLRIFNNLNNLNSILFFLLLAIVSAVVTFFQLDRWVALAVFALVDWLIIAILPKLRVSFGPAHSQVFLLFLLRIPFIWLPAPFHLIFQTIGTILVIYAFSIEPGIIRVSRQEISTKKLTPGSSFRFLQFGDIHLEHIGRREEKLLAIFRSLQPQVILFTGDFLNLSYNEDPRAMRDVAGIFDQIHTIAPTYYVTGSPAVDLEDAEAFIVANTTARHLKNMLETLKVDQNSIAIAGVHCSHKPQDDIDRLRAIRLDPAVFSILLYHSPDLIYELDENANVDLMLSGHTHGGQVRLPFIGAIFSGSLYGRKLQAGLYRLGKTLLYISRGVGLEGMGAPRVRFLCPPEVVLWTIKGKDAAS